MKVHASLSALAEYISCNKQQQQQKNQKLNKPKFNSKMIKQRKKNERHWKIQVVGIEF